MLRKKEEEEGREFDVELSNIIRKDFKRAAMAVTNSEPLLSSPAYNAQHHSLDL